jgi:hypothetical protein
MSDADFRNLIDRVREQPDIVQIIGQRLTLDGQQRILWICRLRAALCRRHRHLTN